MSLLDQILLQLKPGEFANGTGNAAMQPETPAITAPVPGSEGPSVPMSPNSPVAAPKHGGILGALKHFFTPDAGTFEDSMWKNGLYGARSGMQEYQQAQQRQALGDQAIAAKTRVDNARADKELNTPTIAGNNVVVKDPTAPDGVRFVAPTPQETETERLIDRWHSLPPGPLRDLVGRAIKGAQYDPVVIQDQGEARTRTVVAGKKAQRFAPPRAAGGGSTAAKPPAGFILNP